MTWDATHRSTRPPARHPTYPPNLYAEVPSWSQIAWISPS